MTLPRFSTLAKGTLSFAVPSLRTAHSYDEPLGTASAESCYSIFLRHLTLLRRAGISGVPRVVAEIGPGSSIGVRLAALLAGSERYYALDVVDFTNPAVDVAILGAIVQLFRDRAPIPAAGNHSRRFPDLDNYSWPDWLDLGPSEEWESKVATVRKDMASRSERVVKITAPWTDREAGHRSIELFRNPSWNMSMNSTMHTPRWLNGSSREAMPLTSSTSQAIG